MSLYLLTYYASVLMLIIAIIIGIIRYKSLKNLKFIFFILLISFFQIFFSEILFITLYNIIANARDQWRANAFIITNIYVIIEFSLILVFFNSLNKNKKIRKSLLVLFTIGILSYLMPLITLDYYSFMMLKYFSFVSGLIIMPINLFVINKLFQNYNIENKDDASNLIMCIGIFLSNIILWPTIIIQSYIHVYFQRFFDLHVIANSIGYFIMYLFSSIAFYGKNKSRVN